jgi:L-aminopeptidase/D-esterase-like protein
MTDGDTFFGLSTTERPAPDLAGLQVLLTAAADAVTRAVGNAVLAAETVTTAAGTYRAYRDVVAG